MPSGDGTQAQAQADAPFRQTWGRGVHGAGGRGRRRPIRAVGFREGLFGARQAHLHGGQRRPVGTHAGGAVGRVPEGEDHADARLQRAPQGRPARSSKGSPATTVVVKPPRSSSRAVHFARLPGEGDPALTRPVSRPRTTPRPAPARNPIRARLGDASRSVSGTPSSHISWAARPTARGPGNRVSAAPVTAVTSPRTPHDYRERQTGGRRRASSGSGSYGHLSTAWGGMGGSPPDPDSSPWALDLFLID